MSLERAVTTLDQARAVIAERQGSYGSPSSNFSRIAEFWTTIVRDKLSGEHVITPADVAMMMATLKIARMVATPEHLDSAIDGAAYLALVQEVV